MTTTTAAEILAVADRRTRDLIASDTSITLAQWEAFDDTLYRALHIIVGPGRQLSGSDRGITRAVITTFKDYPPPIRPVRGETYSAVEAARLLGSPVNRVTRAIKAGQMHTQLLKRGWLIDAVELDTRPDVTPALADDPNPLPRLSVALGGLADVLTTVDGNGVSSVLTDDHQRAAAIHHVLSIASVAARHALTHLPIAEADRTLRIAQYAERGVSKLAAPDAYPGFRPVPSTRSRPTIDTLDERLEVGLEEWTVTARDELKQHVPSVDVVRNIMTTGIHILATTDAALQRLEQQRPARLEAIAGLREQVKSTALALHASASAWGPVTTAMTPSLGYIAASRDAFNVLATAEGGLRSPTPVADLVDVDGALRNFSLAMAPHAARMATIDALSRQLLGSHLLFVRARAIPPRAATIHARAHGRLVVARPQDVPTLVHTTREAWKCVGELSSAMRVLAPSLGFAATTQAMALGRLSL